MEYNYKTKDGKEVKAFLPEEEIDNDTKKQMHSITENPWMEHVRFMPDAHKGNGCCVGLTSLVKDSLVPNLVGGDIGCGITCLPINIEIKEKKYEKIDNMIKNLIPMGKGKINMENVSDREDWNECLSKCNEQFMGLKKLFPTHDVTYDYSWIEGMAQRIGTDFDAEVLALGSLGSGNHYIEINKDDEGLAYITVHSGSRNLGQKICNYHQQILQIQSKLSIKEFHKRADKIPKKIKGAERKALEDEIYNELESKLTVPWLENDQMYQYLEDMIFTQNYASMNRKTIIRRICMGLGITYDPSNIIETVHNYIDFNRMILRKGAISAEKDEVCIVSLNMRDGILICRGKGNHDWNYSSAHGCGRILNRTQGAKLSLSQFKKEMKDVYSSSVSKATLDESPMAYRDVELIKRCLYDSVDIITQLKPIINCKGI
jgi:RNA-splicing ligase RtcB